MPRISIIVPAYNAERYLEKCVNSVIAQSFADWELILVDDGSKDATGALCDGFAGRDRRVHALHQPNGGVSRARNNGLCAARGDLIAFLDADDWLDADALQTMHSLLTESGVDTVACGNYLAYDDGRTVREAPPMPAGVYLPEEAKSGVTVPLLCDRLRAEPLNGYVWRYLFDRSAIERFNIHFTGAYLEDELFLIEYFCAGTTLAVTDAPLVYYYQNPHSVTKRYLRDFTSTFLNSLAIKDAMISRYDIPVTNTWRDNTCWAGLLIAVSNELAPGNGISRVEKCRHIMEICRVPEFVHALEQYVPHGMQRNKAVVAWLLRHRAFGLLTLLYDLKNRNRG